ncbi:hypothetical protein HYV89_05625 [Candidatus Woesearchaeota archaeon]|nr:hypothetical protein [Candidatus Woesearchaeota archaeon]
MEIYQTHYSKAASFFKSADHLLYVTMPVVKDVKLVATVLDNIYFSLAHGMDSILEFERYYKRLMPIANNFDLRLEVFSEKVAANYGFTKEETDFINEIKKLRDDRKNASMEFTRSGKLIICSESYRMKTISIEEIKKYLSTTKNFLLKVDKIIK